MIAQPVSPADTAAQKFFAAVRLRDYKKAYGLLSPGVQRDVPYGEFARRSADIKSFVVVDLTAVDRGAHLTRFRVKGKVRMVYRGELFSAVYAGTADMSRVGSEWRIAQVDLKPVEQKRIGPGTPGYHL